MTKLLVLEEKSVFERHAPAELREFCDITLLNQFTPAGEILAQAPDADVLLVNPTITVGAELINGLPNLKLIQSEGVYQNFQAQRQNRRCEFLHRLTPDYRLG